MRNISQWKNAKRWQPTNTGRELELKGIGVRAGGAGGAAAPPVAKIFGQNACDSGKSTWDKIFID